MRYRETGRVVVLEGAEEREVRQRCERSAGKARAARFAGKE